MPVYDARQTTAAAFVLTAQAAAAPAFLAIVEIREGNFSSNATVTADRLSIQRSTGGVTPTNQTIVKHSTRSPTNADAVVSAWVTPPTLSGSPLLQLTMLRQAYRSPQVWTPPRPGAAIIAQDAEQIDGRNSDTGGNPAHTLHWSENAFPSVERRLARRPRVAGLYERPNASDNKAGLTNALSVRNNSVYVWSTLVPPNRSFERGVKSWSVLYDTGGAVAQIVATGIAQTHGLTAAAVARDLSALARARTSAGMTLPTSRALVASGLARAQSAGPLSTARLLAAAAMVVARASGVLPATRGLTASGQGRTGGASALPTARQLRGSGLSVTRGAGMLPASRQLIAQAQARVQSQDALVRAVALSATGQAQTRGSSAVNVSALVLLIATAMARTRGSSAMPLTRTLVATELATARDQAALIRAVALIASARSRTSESAAVNVSALVLLVATAFARARSQAAMPVSRLLIASALARTQAQDALIRAVALAAQARAQGRGSAALPEVRRLVSTALASARAAAIFTQMALPDPVVESPTRAVLATNGTTMGLLTTDGVTDGTLATDGTTEATLS